MQKLCLECPLQRLRRRIPRDDEANDEWLPQWCPARSNLLVHSTFTQCFRSFKSAMCFCTPSGVTYHTHYHRPASNLANLKTTVVFLHLSVFILWCSIGVNERFILQDTLAVLNRWDGQLLYYYSAAVGVWSIAINPSLCASVRLSVCLSVREHISRTAGPIFTKFCVQISRGRGSVLIRRRCATLCISGFMDDVTLAVVGATSARVGSTQRRWSITYFHNIACKNWQWCVRICQSYAQNVLLVFLFGDAVYIASRSRGNSEVWLSSTDNAVFGQVRYSTKSRWCIELRSAMQPRNTTTARRRHSNSTDTWKTSTS